MVETEGASVGQHPVWRDEQTAYLATERLLNTARMTGKRVHVLHVTTEEEMDLLAKNRDIATVEVTPQHLTLAAPDCYEAIGSYAQMNPPIREARHREGLWRAIQNGVVDVIGSDHAPHTKDEKSRPYPNSPSGMPGVQTLLPLMLDHVNQGRLSLTRLVDLVCHGPARIYGIANKGRLTLGADADLSLVDMKAKRTITHEQMASRCGWTPFDGKEVQGWPIATIVRGQIVMRDDELQNDPLGQPVRFVDTLPAR
jgi:dihydroorotase